MRLVGVNAPEIKAETKAESINAAASRDWLKSLILNKSVLIVFEKSDTTLDGVARGTYCRPLGYIFIRDESDNPMLVNLEIVYEGHAIKYFKYDFEYEPLFRLNKEDARQIVQDDIWLSIMTPRNQVAESPSMLHKNVVATWGQLKQVRR